MVLENKDLIEEPKRPKWANFDKKKMNECKMEKEYLKECVIIVNDFDRNTFIVNNIFIDCKLII